MRLGRWAWQLNGQCQGHAEPELEQGGRSLPLVWAAAALSGDAQLASVPLPLWEVATEDTAAAGTPFPGLRGLPQAAL